MTDETALRVLQMLRNDLEQCPNGQTILGSSVTSYVEALTVAINHLMVK